jgi:hypothetical protein
VTKSPVKGPTFQHYDVGNEVLTYEPWGTHSNHRIKSQNSHNNSTSEIPTQLRKMKT